MMTIDVDKPRSLDIPKDYDKSTWAFGYNNGQYGKNYAIAKDDPRKCDSHIEIKYHFKRK